MRSDWTGSDYLSHLTLNSPQTSSPSPRPAAAAAAACSSVSLQSYNHIHFSWSILLYKIASGSASEEQKQTPVSALILFLQTIRVMELQCHFSRFTVDARGGNSVSAQWRSGHSVCTVYQQCFSDGQCVCGVTRTQSDLCVTRAVKKQKLFTNSVLNNKLCITCADEVSLVNNSGALLHLKISI